MLIFFALEFSPPTFGAVAVGSATVMRFAAGGLLSPQNAPPPPCHSADGPSVLAMGGGLTVGLVEFHFHL